MEHSTDSRVSSIHTGVGGSVLDPDLPGPLNCGQSKSEGAVLVQLREFKTHLLEAVEELRACRDAEARFKEQISKLVSEKQELQWAKETLQHQSESVAKQQMESLNSVKKQFQAKIKSVEEEKGKYKVSIEIKNKEINSLKEELKSLQLLKVNLEKRICELEQTLLVQNKATGSQLTKLGEVEKHFSTLSKQCAMVTQAHEKLQHNVDEAIKRNVQLASANAKQEEVITSLKKETKMMKTFLEENAALTQEKLDVVRSLQQTHELLLSQTQAVSRAELELQKKDEQYQKAALLEHINKAQQDLLQKHNEPSWQVQVQAQDKKESRSSSRSCSVSTKLLPAEGLVDSKVAAKLAGATGGQNTFSHHQQFKSVTHQNQFTCTPDRNNVFCSLSGGSDGNTIQHFSRSLANQSDPDTMPTSASNVDGREMDQKTEHANRSKDSQMSGENAKNNQEPEIPLKNRDGNETDGKEERQVHTPQEPKY